MMIYLVYALVAGILQYSMYGVIGTGIFDIWNFASPGAISEGMFLAVVYIFVFLIALAMIMGGIRGSKK